MNLLIANFECVETKLTTLSEGWNLVTLNCDVDTQSTLWNNIDTKSVAFVQIVTQDNKTVKDNYTIIIHGSPFSFFQNNT